jgi:hypothetical protein
MSTQSITRRTHDAFALARKPGKADDARALLRALRDEVGDDDKWQKIKASALQRGTFA